MTLEAREEEELLWRVRRIEEELCEVRALLLQILSNQATTYEAPAGFSFAST